MRNGQERQSRAENERWTMDETKHDDEDEKTTMMVTKGLREFSRIFLTPNLGG